MSATGDIVYIVETGDYEQRDIMFVAASPEAAKCEIHATYSSSYIVDWDELKPNPLMGDDCWLLAGRFDEVLGYSTRHTAKYEITPYEVIGNGDKA